MDKKTLLWVIAFSASLFAVNLYFDYRNQESRELWIKQHQAEINKKIELTKEEISLDKPAGTLNTSLLYEDDALQKPLFKSVSSKGSFLVFREKDARLPEKAFVKIEGKTVPLSLKNNALGEGQLGLYSRDENPLLKIGNLPDFGRYNILFVFPKNKGEDFSTTSASIIDGKLEFPLAKLKNYAASVEKLEALKKDGIPFELLDKPGIALIQVNGSYLPLGLLAAGKEHLQLFKNDPKIDTLIEKVKEKVALTDEEGEKFFVLENKTLQLVFSNRGGSVAEINLPFESESNQESVVKITEFDKEMVSDHPYNARFPAHAFFTPGEKGEGPFVEKEANQIGGYYPLIRRDLIEAGKRKSLQVPPQFYSCNFVSEFPELSKQIYKATYFDKEKIVFEASDGRRRVVKTYTLNESSAPYCFDLQIKIEGEAKGIWLTSGVPEAELISGAPAPALKYRMTKAGTPEVNKIDLPTETSTFSHVNPDWISNSNAFFGIIMDPLTEVDPGFRVSYVDGTLVPSRLVEIGEEFERFKAKDLPGYQTYLPLNSKGGTMNFRFFAGPYSTPILKAVDLAYSNPTTGYNPDYISCQAYHGWFAFISEPFAKFLFFLMNIFYNLTGSWGLSIILLTVALRVMLYPLNAWSTNSMMKMQEIGPKVQAIQQKYKNDQKKAQIEIMNLYRESGANPLSGCLPLLIQMPFLIGMFDLLKSSFQLRGASFIPGWIDNLTSPDVLFSWKTPLPLIGNEFHLLPIILGVIMFIQPRIASPLPKDPALWTEQQRQQRAMSSMMAVLFTWMFYNFPSGLNIYWISSMLLGMVQQWWMTRKKNKSDLVVVDSGSKKKTK